uniref:Dynein, axonemal, heavy chain 11 n=1 Tax=Oryzias latipes TaxID=8090 RepID=A0A3P9GZT6_ORYLA
PLLQLSNTVEKDQSSGRALGHTIETHIVNWSCLIQDVLKRDSTDLLGFNPGPKAELEFWSSRMSNLESITQQLQSPIVEKMVDMLKALESSYHPAVKTLSDSVSKLEEATEIHLFLQPLKVLLSQLEEKDFLHLETYTPALFHTLFLIWTNCPSYQKPARIVLLLQEVCNLFIEQVFESQYTEFKKMVADVECRLSSELCLAFQDCTSLESALKLVMMVGSFLERSEIRQKCKPIFSQLQRYFREELESCKFLFKSFKNQKKSPPIKNMAYTSGALKWLKMLRQRIQTPWEYLRRHVSVEEEMIKEYQKYLGMISLLKQHEEIIYSDWCNGLEETYLIHLSKPLILRNSSTGLISVNFNIKQLTEVVKDVKYIQAHGHTNIPPAAVTFYEKRDVFTESLQVLVECYNTLKLTMLKVELPLIRAELDAIDSQLTKAETSLTWQDQDSWGFIRTTKDLVQDISSRISRAKENFEVIKSLTKKWSKQTMFCREDTRKGLPMPLDDRASNVSKKYISMKHDGDLIHEKTQENVVLFHADPVSREWQSYLEYVDEMIAEGLFKHIRHSLQFFVENMSTRPNQVPLFAIQLVLNSSGKTFCPPVEQGKADGFYELIERLLQDVFKTSGSIRRVAAHLSMESYEDLMNGIPELLDLRKEIMELVDSSLKKADKYQQKFDCYTPLWQNDKKSFLSQFLHSGDALTTGEVDVYGTDEPSGSLPTIGSFKEQIDYYETLNAEVSELEDFVVFDGWLRVDIKFFKAGLHNTVNRLSWLFKDYLLTYLTNFDELRKFLRATADGLRHSLTEGDHKGFVEVMKHLLAVRDKTSTIDKMFAPLRDIISLLESYGVTIPEVFYSQMEQELPEMWNETKKLTLKVSQEVAPKQSAEVLILRRQCMDFEIELSEFRKKFQTVAPFSYNATSPHNCLEKSEKEILDMEREKVQLQESSNLLDVTISDFRDIKQCRREITILRDLWDKVLFFQERVKTWSIIKWRQINVDQIDAEVRKFARDLQKLDKDARTWDVYTGLELHVRNMQTLLRVVSQLQNLAVRERHWVQLTPELKISFTVTDSTTLGELLALKLHMFEEEVCKVVEQAVKEMAIEKIVTEIGQTWASKELLYEEHDQNSIPLLKCDEELIEMLEDHQVRLQTVVQSKHVDNFVVQVRELQNQLSVAESVLIIWMEVQKTWAYLESIFKSCDDICQHLPADLQRFQEVDNEFQVLMVNSARTKNVIEATNIPHLFEKLDNLQKLALCEQALADYLEAKRIAFPRFYFISSANLLDILSKGSHPRGLFDSMSDLEFAQTEQMLNPKQAVGMYSKEREYVPFTTECWCYGPVETWLVSLEESMKKSVRDQLFNAVSVYEDRQREQWILDFPAQVALTGSQIWWSNDMELVFRKLEEGFSFALKDYNKKQQISQLNLLIGMLLGDLSPGDRQKITTVCTIDVHARDIVASLIAQKVTTSQAFQWLSQLRHRWDEQEHHCYVNICDAQFLYSYEYLGNTPRLVITPLTDCYITLTQSLHLNMSGAPAGPAGTGKTETTKDLGRAMGVMVYIFNCSEQMDYKSIGNIYKGLAQSGAWGCFDEFNRISVDVLSVVAVQVKTIQDAIRSKKEFLFLDQHITLKPSVGIFITMNPGYAGRAELPENLKALFPCAMVVPDTQLICEIMLVAEGFCAAKLLARKFTSLYNFCKELLSKQHHYDWGLRAVKSVLVLAGALRRSDKQRPEEQVLMHALRDFNMAKILTEDLPIFLGLLGDLFPGLEVERKRDSEFEKASRQSALELGLQPEDTFILKVMQLEELMAVRHSVFVVGNAGTGKSQV